MIIAYPEIKCCEKNGGVKLSRRKFSGLLLYCFVSFLQGIAMECHANEISETSERAIVRSEQLKVYAEASLDSFPVGTLQRGEAVTVKIEIFGSGLGEPWCGILPVDATRRPGYVPCDQLARGEVSSREWHLLTIPGAYSIEVSKAIIKGNQVIVLASLTNGAKKEEIRLLLDTGASSTAISSEAAARLDFELEKAEKSLARVADGSFLDTLIVNLDALEVGPHVRNNMKITVIDRKVPVEEHDGLLGMDFLMGLHYRIDFTNQQIIWQ
jgi:clan AA aspartic protease (TIGR02281 family)